MTKTRVVTDSNFDDQVINSHQPVLVDFWAEWCGPCRMIGPMVEELAAEYEGKAVIVKLNVDENPEVSARFGIYAIPTLMIFKKGKVVDMQVGVTAKAVLGAKLQKQID